MTHGAIIGAGIAGLSTAIFGKDQGLEIDVFERHASIPCDEHLLWIAPNGLHLLSKLGLMDDLKNMFIPQEGMIFSDKNLKPLMTLTGDSLRKSCGFPILALKRRDLWQALYSLYVKKGGKVHFSIGLDRLVMKDHRPSIYLSGKDAPQTYDWVIGADGMGSKVRAAIAPESKVTYQGLRTWLGWSDTPVADRYVGRTIEAWGSNGTRFVLTSLDGRRVHFSALERAPSYEPNNAPIPSSTLSRLRKAFSEFHQDIHSVLDKAEPHSLIRCNFGVVSGIDRPWSETCALIGDAAHGMPPNMGQGASLGLEDALWITHSLSSERDPRVAFKIYGDARKKRVHEMRFLANSMNTLFQPQSRIGSMTRNVLARFIPDALTARRMGQLYQPAIPLAGPLS